MEQKLLQIRGKRSLEVGMRQEEEAQLKKQHVEYEATISSLGPTKERVETIEAKRMSLRRELESN